MLKCVILLDCYLYFYTSMINRAFVFYIVMLILGLAFGLSDITVLHSVGAFVADVFVRIFKCLSTPVLALSLIVTISSHQGAAMGRIWRKTMRYTLGTTFVAALVAFGLYEIIRPENASIAANVSSKLAQQPSYLHYLGQIIPTNLFSPFIDNQVMSVLLVALTVGFATRKISDDKARHTLVSFFQGVYQLLFVVIKWVVAILPIGLFGFICVAANQLKDGANLQAISQYLEVIVLANLIQGFVVLPLWLKYKGINPIHNLKQMLPALSVAFFSKSSTGTLPVTMDVVENNLGVQPKISRFVLPLCTSLNMNGCAAFIFTTVLFVMQNNGFEINVLTMIGWVFISVVAAVGNAGVPMGCFFLSASLLSSMNVPIVLLGIILPFYGIIDMIETALNVWSDSCVANVVNQEINLTDTEQVPELETAS